MLFEAHESDESTGDADLVDQEAQSIWRVFFNLSEHIIKLSVEGSPACCSVYHHIHMKSRV